MKRIAAVILFLIVATVIKAADAGGYSIKIKVNQLKDSTCYLYNYYAYESYKYQSKDTAKLDRAGNVVFDGKNRLPGGFYILVYNQKILFDFIVDKEQHFSIEADTTDLLNKVVFKGSSENTALYASRKFIAEKIKIRMPYLKILEASKNKDSIAIAKTKLEELDADVKTYYKKIIDDNNGTLFAKYTKAQMQVDLPEPPKLANGRPDSVFAFYNAKKHFWDNIDLTDDRMLRVEDLFLNKKLKQYFDNWVIPIPDSINVAADELIEKAKPNKDVFQFVTYWLTYTYESSKIMGMDAVFVHLVDKYYATKQAFWVDSVQRKKIVDRAAILSPLLIGKKAIRLVMPDTTGKILHNLYDVKAKFTILYFWDPTCGHCQKETPKLKEFYDKYKSKGVAVYAVGAENHDKDWKEFIIKHKLNFLNVSDLYNQYNLRQLYDIYSFPVLYVLDENKHILAKRLEVEQIYEFIDRLLKEKEAANSKK